MTSALLNFVCIKGTCVLEQELFVTSLPAYGSSLWLSEREGVWARDVTYILYKLHSPKEISGLYEVWQCSFRQRHTLPILNVQFLSQETQQKPTFKQWKIAHVCLCWVCLFACLFVCFALSCCCLLLLLLLLLLFFALFVFSGVVWFLMSNHCSLSFSNYVQISEQRHMFHVFFLTFRCFFSREMASKCNLYREWKQMWDRFLVRHGPRRLNCCISSARDCTNSSHLLHWYTHGQTAQTNAEINQKPCKSYDDNIRTGLKHQTTSTFKRVCVGKGKGWKGGGGLRVAEKQIERCERSRKTTSQSRLQHISCLLMAYSSFFNRPQLHFL